MKSLLDQDLANIELSINQDLAKKQIVSESGFSSDQTQ